jgi:hypothetical protein
MNSNAEHPTSNIERRKERTFFASVLAILFACAVCLAADPGREGSIQFSNGETQDGRISMTPGKELTLHSGNLARDLSLSVVREIRFRPEKEEMVRHWRFLEAGQTKKEETGEPYPIRHLAAEVVLSDGTTVTGHLYTTVLYVEKGNLTEKVVLLSQQKGPEGMSLQELVYPSRIFFKDAGETPKASVQVVFRPPDPAATNAELCALTWGALARLPATKAQETGRYLAPSAMGAKTFWAAMKGSTLYAGWPAAQDEKLRETVRATLVNVRDFFDERELLGVYKDEAAANVYTLMMLSRKGQTTMEGAVTQPWRFEIWRWRYDEEQNKLMLAGRGYFFRGIEGKQEPPPRVVVSEKMWTVKEDGGTIVVGE